MEEQNLTNALRPGPDCLSIEELGRYADGVSRAGDRVAQAAHIATCGNCQAELLLLQAFSAVRVRDDEAAVVRAGVEELRRRESEIFEAGRRAGAPSRGWLSFGAWRSVLTMAAVLLCVVSGYYLIHPAAPRLPADVSSGAEATRSLTIPVIGPVGDQTAVPDRLQWQPVAGTLRYHVRLLEVDRHELWSYDTADAAVDLPADIRAQISPAKTLTWQVTAYGASNAPIAESDPQRFRLAR